MLLGRSTRLTVPPNVTGRISRVCQKVAKNFFDEQYATTVFHLKDKIVNPKSTITHNGHIVRTSYHNALEHIERLEAEVMKVLSKETDAFGHVIQAKIAHHLREGARLAAWDMMPKNEVELLKQRNLAIYGREEGPDFHFLFDKYKKQHPTLTDDDIYLLIRNKGYGDTSEKYDAKFGVLPVSLLVNSTGIVEIPKDTQTSELKT